MNSRLSHIGREVVRKFHTGKWQQQAASFLADQKKMKTLVLVLTVFFRKRSLAPLLKDAVMLFHYVRDIVSGRYKGYNGRQLTLVVAVLLYVVSPLDLIPDFLTGIGFLDDAALVSYAIRLVDKELCRYLQWKDNTVASDEETKV